MFNSPRTACDTKLGHGYFADPLDSGLLGSMEDRERQLLANHQIKSHLMLELAEQKHEESKNIQMQRFGEPFTKYLCKLIPFVQ